MRVLIVSYYFPPAAGGGVQRVLKWAKYLPEFGVEVDVLAPADPRWLDSGGVEVPPGTTVHRTLRNPTPRSLRPNDELSGLQGLARSWRRLTLQPRRLLLPDTRVAWSMVATPLGRRVLRERGIDAIVSTSPPETDHIVGARLARATGLPWVADLRDSWLDLPHLRMEKGGVRVKHAVNRWLAERTVGRADALTTVSQPLAADLRRRHPQVPVHVITNGVDLEDLRDLPAVAPNPGCLTIVYTGNFFGRQSPRTMLQALTQLLARRPEIVDALTMRFIGALKPSDHTMIDADPALSRAVERIGFLPYREVLAQQRAADLLFLYVAPGGGSQGVFTGKVFEYVAACRPVLALAPTDNVAAALVRDSGAGDVVDPEDVPGIEAALEHAWERWRQSGRLPDVEIPETVTASISRRNQAGQLAELLQSLVPS